MPTVQIGALCYGTDVLDDTIINIGEFTTYVELYINFIEKIQQSSVSLTTGTFAALEKAIEMFQALPQIGEKIAIILTDGNSDNFRETKLVSYS